MLDRDAHHGIGVGSTGGGIAFVDEVFPERPVRQRVLSVPHPLRFLFANDPGTMGAVLGVVHRCLAAHLIGKAGL